MNDRIALRPIMCWKRLTSKVLGCLENDVLFSYREATVWKDDFRLFIFLLFIVFGFRHIGLFEFVVSPFTPLPFIVKPVVGKEPCIGVSCF
jgi:hypothetical protein